MLKEQVAEILYIQAGGKLPWHRVSSTGTGEFYKRNADQILNLFKAEVDKLTEVIRSDVPSETEKSFSDSGRESLYINGWLYGIKSQLQADKKQLLEGLEGE